MLEGEGKGPSLTSHGPRTENTGPEFVLYDLLPVLLAGKWFPSLVRILHTV